MEKELKLISKLLSLVLRHQPKKLGLVLNENGWANVADLIEKMNANAMQINLQKLQTVVEQNDKKRFTLNEDKTMIRASQGHSIEVELNLEVALPPSFLYHGTVAKNLDAIRKQGLQKMSRQHVHLSMDKETAIKVGNRRGTPVILTVLASDMQNEGFIFYLSANNVWLTDKVPPNFIEF
jgi:putative RNA 2'-phosphotransferase